MESKIISGLVSVVMANYNTEEEYLRSAIESILNQTYSNFEFIIIDDGSTNDSVSIIESHWITVRAIILHAWIQMT